MHIHLSHLLIHSLTRSLTCSLNSLTDGTQLNNNQLQLTTWLTHFNSPAILCDSLIH